MRSHKLLVLQSEAFQDMGSSHRDDTGIQQKSGHLVFLSARPESYKGFTEGLSFKRIFEPLVRRGDLYGEHLLPGFWEFTK